MFQFIRLATSFLFLRRLRASLLWRRLRIVGKGRARVLGLVGGMLSFFPPKYAQIDGSGQVGGGNVVFEAAKRILRPGLLLNMIGLKGP